MVMLCEKGELVRGECWVERLWESHGGVLGGENARMQRQSTAPYASR